MVLSFMPTSTSGLIVLASLPLGPSTETTELAKLTLMPVGILICFFPILDILTFHARQQPCKKTNATRRGCQIYSTDSTNKFAANIFLFCLSIRHNPFGRRKDHNIHGFTHGFQIL